MSAVLQFDFVVDKENNKIKVTRDFDAGIDLVWEAWTNPEILDLWWAPKPFKTETKSMDFREGGRWHYCMVGPEGEKHWCLADYIKISHQQHFSALDAFCDPEGNISDAMPRSNWSNTFTDKGDYTTVYVETTYPSLEDLEMVIKMGMKEGFTAALDNLDQWLSTQFKLRQEKKTSTESRVSTYLNFPGNTEEAFNYYKKVFQSEFTGGIQRFGDVPADSDHPPISEEQKDLIIHVELPILGGRHVLMATDAVESMGFKVVSGNNMHINLEPDSREEATRIFNELSEGGKVSMPLQEMFWGAYFGSFTDRYGVNWMVNCQ